MKKINLIEKLQGCSKRNGTKFRQANPDSQPTVSRQSRLMSHRGYLRNLAMIFAVLVMSVANIGMAWGDQTDLISGVTLPDVPSTSLDMSTQTFKTPDANGWIVMQPNADIRNASVTWFTALAWNTTEVTVSDVSGFTAPFTTLSNVAVTTVRKTARTKAIRFTGATDISFLVASGGSRTIYVSLYSYNGITQTLVETKSTGTNSATELLFTSLTAGTNYIAYMYESTDSNGWVAEIAIKKYAAAGSGWGIASSDNSWTASADEMSGSGTVTKTLSLSANADLQFKIVDISGNTWYGNGEIWGGTKTQSVSSTGTANNCHLLTTEAGSYTFSFNTSTKDLTITYPNSYTFYYANTSSWSNVYVYKFTTNGSTGKNAAWPGTQIASPAYSCGGTDYYAATSDGYAKLIFTNNSGNQTGDMVVSSSDAGKYVGGTGSSWSAFPTYTVTYNKNGDGAGGAGSVTGSVPTDSNSPYACGSTVTVLGNTGSLALDGYTFAGWNTAPGGGGTSYAAAATFTISANTTLYAQWEEAATCSGDPTALVSGTLYQVSDMASACLGEITSTGQYFYGLSSNGKFYINGTTNSNNASTGTVEIKTASNTIDKVNFTGIAWFKGAGTNTCRSIKFVVPSAGTLTIYGKTSSSKGNVVIKTESSGNTTVIANSVNAYASGSTTVSAGTYYVLSDGESAAIVGLKFVEESCSATQPGAISKGTLSACTLRLTAGGSPAANNTWYWQSSADGTDKTESGATKDVTTTGTYYIRSYCTTGSGCWSDARTVTVSASDLTPAAPTALAKSAETAKGATLTITDGANTNDYDFYVSTSSSTPGDGTSASYTSTSKSITITDKYAGTTFYAWARAKCGSYKSGWTALTGNTFTTSTVTVTHTLTNVSKTSGEATAGGSDYTAVYAADAEYSMPTPTVTIDGNTATSGTDYTWNAGTGTITIPANKINGNIVITLNSVPSAPSSAVISGTYHYFPGENISLTCTPSGNNGPTTYQWYKGGKADGNRIDGATSATYTKNSCTFDDAGSYYCKVTCNATSIWAVTNSHENYDVKILRLYVNGSKGGDPYGNVDFVKVNSTTATASISLGSNWTYGFNIADGCGHYYGNSGTMQYNSYGPWVTDQNGVDCGLTTTNAATYVFTINYSNLERIETTVTFPSGNQTSGKVIYFDNNDLQWENVYYRIGKNDHVQSAAMTKVYGTANLYQYTTPTYNNFAGWHITNAAGATGSYSVYNTKNGTAITEATAFEGAAVTQAAVTVTPTSSHATGETSDNNNCEFYTYGITTGMKTQNVEISPYTNGTITVNYTNTSNVASTLTSGNADLAHSVILTSITAVPNTGYDASAITINGGAYSANYVVTGATTIAATFSLHNYNVTYSAPGNGNSYTIKVADGSATSESKTATMGQTITIVASPVTGYDFTGWTITKAGGGTVEPVNASATTTTFTMPTDDVTITASFTLKTYTVNFAASPAGYGSVSPTSIASVNHGSTVSIASNVLTLKGTNVTATPTAAGADYTYAFSGWSVSNGAAITESQTITANFTRTANQYSVTHSLTNMTTGSGATGANAATYGTDYTATLNANSGYSRPASITVTAGATDITANCTWNQSTGAVTIPGAYITGNITITAAAVLVYTVTFNSNGGSAVSPISQATTGASITMPAAPTYADHTFQGWVIGGTTYAAGASYTPTANVTAYALWRADCSAGGGSTTLFNVDFTDETTEEISTANSGATFVAKTYDGYNMSFGVKSGKAIDVTNGTGVNFKSNNFDSYQCLAIPLTLTKDNEVTAVVTLHSSGTVKYKWVSGSLPATPSVSSPSTYSPSSATNTLTYTPSSAGNYVLYLGRSGSGNGSQYIESIVITQEGGGGTCYYVTYDGNGAESGSISDATAYASGANVTVLGNTGGNAFVKAGNTFTGWNTLPNGTGTPYAAGGTISGISGNVTLYAQWDDGSTYTLTVSGASVANPMTEEGKTGAISGATITGSPVSGISSGTTTSTSDNTFTVNKGTPVTVTASASVAGTAAECDECTYVFDHWTNVPATVTANVSNIQAVYNTTYAIVFKETDESAVAGISSTSYVYGTGKAANTLPTPTKSGYDFGGWYKENTLTNVATDISTTDYGNITYYAKWTEKTDCEEIFAGLATNTTTFAASVGSATTNIGSGGDSFSAGGYSYSVKPNSSNAVVASPKDGKSFEAGDSLIVVIYNNQSGAKNMGFTLGSGTYRTSVASKTLHVFRQVLVASDINGSGKVTFNRQSSDDRWVEIIIKKCGLLPTCTTPVIPTLTAKTLCPGETAGSAWDATVTNAAAISDAGESVSYVWKKKGSDTPVSSVATYTPTSVTESMAGTYVVTATVTKTGKASSSASAEVDLTVTPATETPSVTASKAKVYATDEVTLTATCGSTGVTWNWYLCANSDGTGAGSSLGTSATYTIASAPAAGTYYYKAVATGDGTHSCGAAEYVYTLVVSAANSCDKEFWFAKEGDRPTGAAAATHITGCPSGSSSASYTASIDGTNYTLTGSTGQKTGNVTIVVPADNTGTLYVVVQGSSSRTITLSKGGTQIGQETPANSTWGVFTFDDLDAGTYTLVSSGNISWAMMALKLCPTVACTDDTPTAAATNATVCAGGTITITATGYEAGANFQWQKQNASTSVWENIDGATSDTYTVTTAAAEHAGNYHIVATKGCARTSNTVTIAVPSAPVFGAVPSSVTVMQTIALSISTVEASDAVSYTWYKSADATWDAGDVEIGTDQTLIKAYGGETAGSTYYVFCRAQNACGITTSSAIAVNVTTYVEEDCATKGNEGEAQFGFENTSCSQGTYSETAVWTTNSRSKYLTYTAPEGKYLKTAKVTVAVSSGSKCGYAYSTDGGTTWTYAELTSLSPTLTEKTINLRDLGGGVIDAFRISRNLQDGGGTDHGVTSGNFYLSKACFEYTDACTATEVARTAGNASYDYTYGSDFTKPTFALQKASDHSALAGTLNYSSSNENVASVDDNGDIDFTGVVGSVTITVAFAGGTISEVEYCASQATYTINVTCSDVQPKITTTGDNISCQSSITLNAVQQNGSAFADGSFQWYRDGEAIDGATSASYIATRAGLYTVSRTATCTKMSSNSANITNTNIEPEVERLTPFQYYHVDSVYRATSIMRYRHLFAVKGSTEYNSTGKNFKMELSRNGGEAVDVTTQTSIVVTHSADNTVDTVLLDLNALNGKYNEGDELVLTCKAVTCGGSVSDTYKESIEIHVINKTKPTLALICSGAEGDGTRTTSKMKVGGDFLTGYNKADLCQQTGKTAFDKNTEWGLYTKLKEHYIVTPVNGYAEYNRLNYEPFDILFMTDYPKASKSDAAATILDDMADLCDYRPLFSFKTHMVHKTPSKWAAKGFTTAPVVPKNSRLRLNIVCYAHPMFEDLKTASATNQILHDWDDGSQLVYTMLSGAGYESSKGMQGFEIDAAENFVTIGLVHYNATARDSVPDNTHVTWDPGSGDRMLVAAAERQAVMEARMILFSLNAGAHSKLNTTGENVVLKCLEYLSSNGGVIEPADCSLTFDNNNGSGDGKWSTATNWAPNRLNPPGKYNSARIAAPVTVDVTHAEALELRIIEGGSVTIPAGKALEVTSTIRRMDGHEISPTEISDIHVASSESGNGTLIFNNNSGDSKAQVDMYSKGFIDGEGVKNYQYIGTPFNYANALYNYYGSWIYSWGTKKNGSLGWVVVKNGGPMTAWTGYCITQESPTYYETSGTLTATGTVDINVPADANMVVGNSWTAPIDINAFTDDDFENLTKSVYFFNTGVDKAGTAGAAGSRYAGSTYVTVPVEAARYEGEDDHINSLQGFFVKNPNGSAGTLHLDYERHVRKTTRGSIIGDALHAPARRTALSSDEPVVLKMKVSGENYDDKLLLLEREDFTEGFDNGWDGDKWDGNESALYIYTTDSEGTENSVSAIPELEGTIIGFRAGEDDAYTLNFEYLNSDEPLYLYDVENNTYTQIMTGMTYRFFTTDNEKHERFIITRSNGQEVATGVESTSGSLDRSKAKKLLIEDKMFIMVNGMLYDATGKVVK